MGRGDIRRKPSFLRQEGNERANLDVAAGLVVLEQVNASTSKLHA